MSTQPTAVLVDIQGEDLNLSCELPVDTHLACLIDERQMFLEHRFLYLGDGAFAFRF